ncbi:MULTISPECIES: hypothetical protein [Streptomyces]|uniref:DUF4190 domain-containing protein n=1 Tax=Streptomyces murinus TaxID=33900 RepID=A0A7W3NVB9_STRMR|nr:MULTISPECIES: hypothetical protein [Streptomyces]MBA9057348.1 hypothetical protein [Streptomyces murinus]UWW91673.1 hypothetical protein GO605_13040 [Streptomyces murinus]WSI88946.1 hypothetical protein OG516_32460 [Streptomyces murinus]
MSDHVTPSRNDSPATLLGPTALVLGVIAFLGTCPLLLLFPLTLLAGALAVTLGLAGARYARQGVGRMWPAATGTVLGAAGFVFPMVLLSLMY